MTVSRSKQSDGSVGLEEYSRGTRLVVAVVMTNERTSLSVLNADITTVDLDPQSPESLTNTDKGEESEDESGPVDECVGLVSEDGEEADADDDGAREVTLGGAEGVGADGHVEAEATLNRQTSVSYHRRGLCGG
jgi:hypothetical protein